MQVQYVLHLLPCTHQDDIQLHAKHFAIKLGQFLQSLFVFNPSRHWRNENLIFHKAPREKVKGGQIWRLRRPGSGPPLADPSLRQLTAYSRMLSPHCGCVVVLRHVEKQHLVCLQVAGGINHNSNMSW
jgi:hypothetical protein